LVEGVYRLLFSDESLPVNIGNPFEMTILEFAEAVLELTRSNSEIVYVQPEDDRTTDDPKVRRPDISKARQTLGWEPKVNLADGLTETISFFRDRVK
jgi:dTDP-glucose 4,6-dehydratase